MTFYLLGLVGHPVEHSLSPVLHKAALKHYGLEGDYRLLDLSSERIEQGVADLIKEGYTGFNVTIPHKQTFYDLVSENSEESQQLRAVNSVRINDEKRLLGHNTDLGGFQTALTDALPATHKYQVACVIGSGGSARAAVWGLVRLGWPKVVLVARNLDAAEILVKEVVSQGFDQTKFFIASTDLSDLNHVPDVVINCTPIGLTQELPEWAEQLLKWSNPEGLLFDMVYSRESKFTALTKEAHRLRLRYVDGREMLIHQAALAFEFWTGKPGPVRVMRDALEAERDLITSKR